MAKQKSEAEAREKAIEEKARKEREAAEAEQKRLLQIEREKQAKLEAELKAKQEDLKSTEEEIKSAQTEQVNYQNLLNTSLEREVRLKKVIDIIPKPWGLSPFPYDFQALLDIVFPDDLLLDEFIRQAKELTNGPGGAGFADLHFKLGMAYRSKGLITEALAEFRQTILINPDFHLARHYFWHLEEERQKVVKLP